MGQTPAGLPTLKKKKEKKKSLTFPALFTAKGNVIIYYDFLSVSIKFRQPRVFSFSLSLSVRASFSSPADPPALLFFLFLLFFCLTFLHLVSDEPFFGNKNTRQKKKTTKQNKQKKQNQKCCLTCADVSYHTNRVLFWEWAGLQCCS